MEVLAQDLCEIVGGYCPSPSGWSKLARHVIAREARLRAALEQAREAMEEHACPMCDGEKGQREPGRIVAAWNRGEVTETVPCKSKGHPALAAIDAALAPEERP